MVIIRFKWKKNAFWELFNLYMLVVIDIKFKTDLQHQHSKEIMVLKLSYQETP